MAQLLPSRPDCKRPSKRSGIAAICCANRYVSLILRL
jgi:hypothetical protein